MKRRAIILVVTVIALLISGTIIQSVSSPDAISGATKRSKPKVVTVTNTAFSNTDLTQAETELTIADKTFPSALDPAGDDNGRFALSYGVGETLVLLDNELNVQPWLAQSWVNIDPFTWEISLKPDVKYHNGMEMTAQSVKDSLERAVHLNDTAAELLPLSSIQAEGLTLTICTSEPYPELLHNLADPVFIIVDTQMEQTKDFSYFPICTGPFIPVEFTGNTEVILRRFDSYHGGIPSLESVTVQHAADTDKLVKALEQESASVAADIPLDALSSLTEKGYLPQQTASASAWLLIMNMDNTIFADENVRQAIALATDRQSESGAFAPLLPFSDNVEPYSYDPSGAKTLLEDSGYADTNGDGIMDKNGSKLSLRLAVAVEDPELLEWAQTLKSQLMPAGIEISVKAYSDIFFTSRARYGKFDMMLLAVPTAENGNVQHFFEDYFASSGTLNYGHYHNEQVDNSIQKLRCEFNTDQRILLTEQIQALVLEDAAFVFLGYPQINLVLQDGISGLTVHPAYGCRLTANTTVEH